MDPTGIFSTKAEKYARYRWDYAPTAIQRTFEQNGITSHSVVADIGAGTGDFDPAFRWPVQAGLCDRAK